MLLPFSLGDARSLDVASCVHSLVTGTVHSQSFVVGMEAQISDPMAALLAPLRPHIVRVPFFDHTRMLVEPCILVLSALMA